MLACEQVTGAERMKRSAGGLAWSTAWKIAWRDLHASWIKFTFVVVAVALGVGSLTGVRSFSLIFQRTLLAAGTHPDGCGSFGNRFSSVYRRAIGCSSINCNRKAWSTRW